MKNNNFQFFRGTVDKSTTANSMSSIKEYVAKEHAPRFEAVYAERTQKDMSDEEIERKAQSSINSDSDFLFELMYGKRGNK